MQKHGQVKRKCSQGGRAAFLLFGASLIAIGIVARATPPGLSITTLTNGVLQLTVTNGAPGDTYQILYTPNFDPGYQWNVNMLGETNQTNFTLSTISTPSGFYKAVNNTDFDNDGIPNYEDANATDSSIGLLTVIIDTPTNGYTFR